MGVFPHLPLSASGVSRCFYFRSMPDCCGAATLAKKIMSLAGSAYEKALTVASHAQR
jgi:hypothetical protein